MRVLINRHKLITFVQFTDSKFVIKASVLITCYSVIFRTVFDNRIIFLSS